MLHAFALNGAHVVTSLAASRSWAAAPAAPPGDLSVTIPDLWLAFIVGTVLPAVVALVTKRFAGGAVKAVVLVVLSVLGGWLVQLQATGGTFAVKDTLVSVFMTLVTAVAAHFGLLKPLNVTGAQGVIARAVPAGIGGDARRGAHEYSSGTPDVPGPGTPGGPGEGGSTLFRPGAPY